MADVKLTNVFHRTGEALIRALNGTGPRLIINQGGQGCFGGDQKIITESGPKPLRDVKVFERVLSKNMQTGSIEMKKVVKTFCFKNTKRSVEITLKNGDKIRATEAHLFFYKGKWVELKKILNELETNTGL